MRAFLCIVLLVAAASAQNKPVFPPGVKPVGPYSPGVLAGDSLYVSGQGAQKADGSYPSTPEEQLRQCLENVRTVVETAADLEKMLGSSFNQLAYHDFILSQGLLPPGLMRQAVLERFQRR